MRKEMLVVSVKIVKEVFILMKFEVSTTDFYCDDLFIGECRCETTATDFVSFFGGIR